MGDEDERDADVALDRLQLDLHLLAQLEVERAERLVEQQHLRTVDERSGERDALALAARELVRACGAPKPPRRTDVEHLGRAPAPLGLAHLLDHQPVLDVLLARSCAGTARSPGRPCSRRGRTAATWVTSLPWRRIAPAVGSSKPAIIRSIVVLPEPDGPSSAKNSPSTIVEVDVVDRDDVAERFVTPTSRTASFGWPRLEPGARSLRTPRYQPTSRAPARSVTTMVRRRCGTHVAARRECGRPAAQAVAAHPLGDDLRRAAGLHRDAEQRSRPASIVRFWWLTTRSCASSRNSSMQAEEPVEVDVVERRLDLVHHVEGRRPAAEHGEQEGQRGERALAAGQQRQLLHVLARRLGLDLDAGVEQVVGLVRTSWPRPPGNSVANSAVKLLADVGEGGGEHASGSRRRRP